MFFRTKPGPRRLQAIRDANTARPTAYSHLGSTALEPPPAGYVRDDNRVRLGTGAETFRAAADALRDWAPLRLGWIEPAWPDAALQEGTLQGTVACLPGGLHAVNVCRIVEVIDDSGPVERFGFVWATLPGHAECGEERFLVERRLEGDSVWYVLRADSRPGSLLTRLGYPVARRLQRRFARDSLRAVQSAVGSIGPEDSPAGMVYGSGVPT